jgi:anti-sigma factor RsiW
MMNDETQQLLSAYLDGALPEPERLAVEARLASSAELRRELDELRAVSRSVKELPKQPLPAGFMARFQARRARGDAPRQDWVFLPPAARPVAFALSCGVVALVIWDKVVVPPPLPPFHSVNEAKVAPAANAPLAPFDVSRRAAGEAVPDQNAAGGSTALTVVGPAPEPVDKAEVLPRLQDEKSPAPAASAARANGLSTAGGVASLRGSAKPARAAGRPLEADAAGAGGSGAEEPITDRTRIAMTEEERSARNEQMFDYIEGQKKKMGIAQVLPKAARKRDVAELSAPAIAAPAPTMLKKAEPEGLAAADSVLQSPASVAGRLAPDAGLVFGDARSLGSSWILLGFPGIPPAMDFTTGRLLLIKPSATKILSVTTDAGAVSVAFRSLRADETADPAKDRVAPLPLEPKTVLIFDVSPR